MMFLGRRRNLTDWQDDCERRAPSGPLTAGSNDSSVAFDEMSGDRKPEAEAVSRCRQRTGILTKSLEDVRQEIATDSFAIVADGDRCHGGCCRCLNDDMAAGR